MNCVALSVEYKVVKNTLLELASEGTDMEMSQLPTSLVRPQSPSRYDDPVAAAKVLGKFAKDQQATFKLKVGRTFRQAD